MTPSQRFRKRNPNYHKLWMRLNRGTMRKTILGVRCDVQLLRRLKSSSFELQRPLRAMPEIVQVRGKRYHRSGSDGLDA